METSTHFLTKIDKKCLFVVLTINKGSGSFDINILFQPPKGLMGRG